LWLAGLVPATSCAFPDGGPSIGEPMEILVVEDEVRLAQHISRALTEAGHEPVMVHDRETALGKAELKRIWSKMQLNITFLGAASGWKLEPSMAMWK
jgi:ActR/RegA family two-component response regulator